MMNLDTTCSTKVIGIFALTSELYMWAANDYMAGKIPPSTESFFSIQIHLKDSGRIQF